MAIYRTAFLSFPTIIIMMFLCVTSHAREVYSVGAGDWSNPQIWNIGEVPSPSDTVIIGHAITGDKIIVQSPGGLIIKVDGSLSADSLINNTAVYNKGVIKVSTILNNSYSTFSNGGTVESSNFVLRENSFLQNYKSLLVSEVLRNAGLIDQYGTLEVGHEFINDGYFYLKTGSTSHIADAMVNNQQATIKFVGILVMSNQANPEKSLINYGLLEGAGGGIVGVDTTIVLNEGSLVNDVLICLPKGKYSNSGSGSFKEDCCFGLKADAGEDRPVCSVEPDSALLGGDPLVVGGMAPYTISWTNVTNVTNEVLDHPKVYPADSTGYILTVIDANNCTVKDTISIVPTNRLMVRVSETKLTVCRGNSVSLEANVLCGIKPYQSVQWTPATYLDDASSLTPTCTPEASTTYQLVATDANGTTVTVRVDVEVLDWPSVPVANDDMEVCGQQFIQLSAEQPSMGYGRWIGSDLISFEDEYSPETVARVPIGETFFVVWSTNNDMCKLYDTVFVVNHPRPTPAMVGAHKYLCETTSVQLGANTPIIGTGKWSFYLGEGALTDDTDPVATLSNIAVGDTTAMIWTVSYLDCEASRDTVLIVVNVPGSEAIAGESQYLCNQTSITLNAEAPSTGKGLWRILTSEATLEEPSNPNALLSALPPNDTLTLEWSVGNRGCGFDRDTIFIVNFTNPTQASAGPDQVLCGESQTTLAANTPIEGLGTWYQLTGGNIESIHNPLSVVSALNIDTVSIFYWEIKNGACGSSTDTVRIMVWSVPGVEFDSVAFCSGAGAQLVAFGGQTYSWTPTTGLENPSVSNPFANPDQSGSYQVQITNLDCANATFDIKVNVLPYPQLEVSADTTIFIGQSVELLATGDGVFAWEPSSGLDNATIGNPVASPTVTTKYYVSVTNDVNCESIDSVVVTVNSEVVVFVPEMFTPNNDGNNDLLFANVTGAGKIKFTVFNRSGQVVFTTEDPQTGWDGTYNGKDQNMDTYIYYLEAESLEGELVSKKGTVQLAR